MPFERSPYAGSYDEDVNVSAFRRVHVIPFEGDLLRSLVRIGTQYRDLVLKYSAYFDPENPRLLPETLAEFKRLLDEFDELRKTNIYPLAELAVRQGPKDNKAILAQWIKRTGEVVCYPLNDPFFRARASEEQIRAISEWLLNDGPPKLSTNTANFGYYPLSDSTYYNTATGCLSSEYAREQYRSRFASRRHVSSTTLILHGSAGWRLFSSGVEPTRVWSSKELRAMPPPMSPPMSSYRR